MCPELALRLVPADPEAPDRRRHGGRPAAAARRMLKVGREPAADTTPDLVVSEDWIAEISSVRAIPPPR